jgi:hypothetical protein
MSLSGTAARFLVACASDDSVAALIGVKAGSIREC